MYNFIVLGLIPGTDFQISFAMWLIGDVILGLALVFWLMRRAHVLRNWLIATTISWTIRRRQLA